MPKIRVLIVDDHAIVRDGLAALLALTDDIEVVGEATNGLEALDLVGQVKPDVVLMDISMPVMDGMEATRLMTRDHKHVKILVLTQHDDKEFVFPVIESGAAGFISKSAAANELTQGIRAVYQGDSFLSPPIARMLLDSYKTGAGRMKPKDPYELLTDREREVLKLLAEGRSTHEIAELLVITPKTVEGHKTRLMMKLGIHGRVDIVKYALRKGIIDI
jgi:two-component system response regulator NreC